LIGEVLCLVSTEEKLSKSALFSSGGRKHAGGLNEDGVIEGRKEKSYVVGKMGAIQ